jgi:hypothetical protein
VRTVDPFSPFRPFTKWTPLQKKVYTQGGLRPPCLRYPDPIETRVAELMESPLKASLFTLSN